MPHRPIKAAAELITCLFLLAGCFAVTDRSRDREVVAAGFLHKQFVLTMPGLLFPPQKDDGVLLPIDTDFRSVNIKGPSQLIPAGTRIRISRIVQEDTIEITYNHTLAILETGPQPGVETQVDFFVKNAYFAWPPGVCDDRYMVPYVGNPLPWAGDDTAAAIPKMIAGLHSTVWAIRWHAANSLGKAVDPQTILPLQAALDDPDIDVRSQTWKALLALHPATTALIEKSISVCVNRPHANTYDEMGAIKLLAAMGEASVPTLSATLRRTDLDDQAIRNILDTLNQIGPPADAAIPAIIDSLRLPHHDANYVGSALLYINPTEGMRRLLPLLHDPTLQQDTKSIVETLSISAHGLVPQIALLLQDPDPALREMAARSLGYLPENAGLVTPPLIAALADPATPVRLAAVRALDGIAGHNSPEQPRIVDALRTAMNDPDSDVRKWAADAVKSNEGRFAQFSRNNPPATSATAP